MFTIIQQKTASIKDIGKAYKNLVMKWNPDKNYINKHDVVSNLQDDNQSYQVILLIINALIIVENLKI